jgi:hypothetical protein
MESRYKKILEKQVLEIKKDSAHFLGEIADLVLRSLIL